MNIIIENRKRDIIKKTVTASLLILIVLIILPELLAIKYSVPSADDFSYSLGWINCNGNHFIYLLDNLKEKYLNWQGTYTGWIIGSIPVYYLFGLEGLRIALFLIFCLLIFSIVTFTCSVTISLGIEYKKSVILAFSIFIFFYIFNTNTLDEIIYWYCGACVYTIPLSIGFICVSVCLLYLIKRNSNLLFLAILLAIIGSGGALCISGFLCSMLLFIQCYNLFVKKEINKSFYVFLASFFGSFINAIAPGNFVRRAEMKSQLSIVATIQNVFERLLYTVKSESDTWFLFAFMIITFAIVYCLTKNKKIKFNYPILVVIFGLLGVFITDFPIIFGYGDTNLPFLPSRGDFVEHVSIIVYSLVVAGYLGGWFSAISKGKFARKLSILTAIFMVCFPLIFFKTHDIIKIKPYKMIYHIKLGDYDAASDREENYLFQIATAKEKNVIVYSEAIPDNEWTNIKKIEISEDKNDWVNNALSKYYKKDTIELIYE